MIETAGRSGIPSFLCQVENVETRLSLSILVTSFVFMPKFGPSLNRFIRMGHRRQFNFGPFS